MTQAVEELLEILDLEKIEEDLFRGRSPQVGWQRVFGGLVIAQALVAAQRTVHNAAAHSLHAYFLLGGDPTTPIVYQVERLRDGRSFATRRCQAIQHGRVIFTLAASFFNPEQGLEHAFAPPEVAAPEDLPDESVFIARYGAQMPEPVRRYFQRERPIEMRPVDPGRFIARGQQDDPVQKVWVRATGRLPDDPAVHRATLAYFSDMTLLDTSLIAHGRSVFHPDIQAASLDHALWLHRPFRADEWMLYVQDSPNARGGLGFSRGALYSRDGALIASVAQEGLIRLRREPATGLEQW
ncbi:acyl-CoA thioesterase II [Rhodoblastus sphagnicola]|uniref:Acyl-CoA thioesterase 2 n=1 Tax=Rhodoblastus sphagnicola TaxID=333368 RepID=A0A2S6N8M6_9HYPH|nr:acyl-CoA thioesterase II [Rhodoblastus sphagnicola]MBB4199951.1 acyl-CoA thioesterase-2 [Rhodoblastus sphagnicola]PPQ30982.1 acyl-CoA thioesterase II [Rhodoblastus sphagnicola]